MYICMYVSILLNMEDRSAFFLSFELRRAREIMLYTKRLKDPTKGNFRDWKNLLDFYRLMNVSDSKLYTWLGSHGLLPASSLALHVKCAQDSANKLQMLERKAGKCGGVEDP